MYTKRWEVRVNTQETCGTPSKYRGGLEGDGNTYGVWTITDDRTYGRRRSFISRVVVTRVLPSATELKKSGR